MSLQDETLEPLMTSRCRKTPETTTNSQGMDAEVHSQKQNQQQQQQQHQEQDPLSTASYSLSVNVTKLVQLQLQGNNELLKLIEKMNLRTAEDYNEFGDFAAGLRVFVERLKLKNDSFQQYSHQMDEIEQELTELEAVISVLDTHTRALEAKLKSAYKVQMVG